MRSLHAPGSMLRVNGTKGLDHVRHRRHSRAETRSRAISSTRCGGSSTAAMTRPASPPSRTATSSAAAPRASSATWSCGSPTRAAAGPHRHRPHPLGHPRRADRAQRPPAHDRAASPSSTTASSRTSASCATSSPPRATVRRPRPTPRSSLHLVTDVLRPRACRRSRPRRRPWRRLDGAFALAILFAGEDDLMIGARQGSPLAIGYGDGEMYLGSDAIALAPFTDRITYLEEGDWAVLTRAGATIFDAAGTQVERAAIRSRSRQLAAGRQGQPPPLHGQGDPRAARGDRPHARALHRLRATGASRLPELGRRFRRPRPICHRRLRHRLLCRPRRQVLVRAARAPAGRDRRRLRIPLPRAAAAQGRPRVFVSQSGETADTLAALRYCKAQGQRIAVDRQRPRPRPLRARSTWCCRPCAGPEIGVASTKAFTCQLAVLACLAIALGRAARHASTRDAGARAVARAGRSCRASSRRALQRRGRSTAARPRARQGARRALPRPRRRSIPLALEGALKLKEISYIHAEGYAAGELKHGPIALIDETCR